MKKVLVVVFTLMLSASAMAQQTVESQITELKQKIEAQQQQLNGLSQRVSEVEQLNVDLRKAMDFGKAITTMQGSSSVTYKLISLIEKITISKDTEVSQVNIHSSCGIIFIHSI